MRATNQPPISRAAATISRMIAAHSGTLFLRFISEKKTFRIVDAARLSGGERAAQDTLYYRFFKKSRAKKPPYVFPTRGKY